MSISIHDWFSTWNTPVLTNSKLRHALVACVDWSIVSDQFRNGQLTVALIPQNHYRGEENWKWNWSYFKSYCLICHTYKISIQTVDLGIRGFEKLVLKGGRVKYPVLSSPVYVVSSMQSIELIQLTSSQLQHARQSVVNTGTCCRRSVRQSGRRKLMPNTWILGNCGTPLACW